MLPKAFRDIPITVYRSIMTRCGEELPYIPQTSAEAIHAVHRTDARMAAYVIEGNEQPDKDYDGDVLFHCIVQEIDVEHEPEKDPFIDVARVARIKEFFPLIEIAVKEAEYPASLIYATKTPGSARLITFMDEPIFDKALYERKSAGLRRLIEEKISPNLPWETKPDPNSVQWERRWALPWISYRKDSNTYGLPLKVLGDSPRSWAEIPEEAGYVRKKTSADSDIAPAPIVSILPLAVRLDRLGASLSKIRSVSGQGGHNACFRAANTCAYWLPENPKTARAVMEWWNSEFADPPWDSQQLEHKLEDAYANRRNRI